MSNLTNITTVFATASEASSLIAHKPNKADLQRFNEALVVCCLSVILTGTNAGFPSWIVLTAIIYRTSYSSSFSFMHAAWAEYNPVIALILDDATRVVKTCVVEYEGIVGK